MKTVKEEKNVIIGEKIRRLRKEKNYSQQQLAKAIGISTATLSSYETGKTSPPIAIAVRIAMLFGVSLNQVLDINDNEPEVY